MPLLIKAAYGLYVGGMTLQKSAYIALDTAYEHGLVVLFSLDGVQFSAEMPKKLDHAKEISSAMKKTLAYGEEQGFSLQGIFSGVGPGSFVGVRIALASALGFSFANDLPLMSFCSHRALIRSNKDCSVFMRASGHLGYLTRYTAQNGILIGSVTELVPMDELKKWVGEEPIFSDRAEELFNLSAQKICGPSAQGIYEACLLRLSSGLVDEKDFIKPNYVKAPSALPKWSS